MMPKEIFNHMIMVTLKLEDYYFARFMDDFYMLSDVHQKGLAEFLVGEIGSKKWEKMLAEDDYRSLMTDILLFFGGQEKWGQPAKNELRRHIGNYYLHEFEKIEAKIGAESFADAMEKIS